MKYIKLTLCCFLFIITIVTYGQKTSVIPSAKELVAYKLPRNEMYKKGWIDFNKNGVMDTYENPDASLDASEICSEILAAGITFAALETL